MNLTTYRFYCLKRQFCMISKYSVVLKSKELSFWSINYVSGIKTKFLEYKICFKRKNIKDHLYHMYNVSKNSLWC